MIPILIAPVLNRYDLLDRMIASVDHTIDHLFVVDNGRTGWHPWPAYEARVGSVHVIEPASTGMGYGGAINHGITSFPGMRWWMWASNDVVFEQGYLNDVVAEMEDSKEALILTGGFTWAAINRAAVERVGLIDEWAFYPIYFDDNDYHYRCILAGVDWREAVGGWRHGDDKGIGSVTIRSDPALLERNHQTFEANKAAYIDKWGGLPGAERYTSPWNEGCPVRTVRPDIASRAQRRW